MRRCRADEREIDSYYKSHWFIIWLKKPRGEIVFTLRHFKKTEVEVLRSNAEFFKATKEITHDFYARQKVLLRTGQGDILKADTRDSENTRMKVTHWGDSVGLLTHTNTHTHTENKDL